MTDDENRRGNATNSRPNSVSGVVGVSARASVVEPAMWRAADVARYLSMSLPWVYKQAELGTLPCVRLGAAVRFPVADIRAWAERQRVSPGRVVSLRSSIRVDE